MVFLSLLFVLIYSALIGFSNGISLDEPNDRPDVDLTIQFTASYPPQIPPTSTVYGAIVTNILKVVDCNYVQVENLNHYVPPEGQFSFRTTVPVLTRYHVTCMDPSTVITRLVQDVVVATAVPEAVEQSRPVIDLQHKLKRSVDETASSDVLLSVAERLSAGIDPSNENLTVREFRYLREINTALFSMNIVNSGLPLKSMCQYLQDPSIENNLEGNYIDSKQAANIICFASVYGLYLGQSNDKILSDLAALEYAVQMHAYHSEALLQVCKTLSYSAAQMLGIDADGIQTYVCNGTAGVDPTSTSTSTGPSVIMSTGTSETSPSHNFPSASGSDVSTVGSGSTIKSWTPLYPTSIPSSFLSTAASVTASRSDIWNATGTTTTDTVQGTGSSIIFGTGGSVFSSATSAAGTVAPWFTETGASPVPTVVPSSIVGSEQAASTTGATRVASFYVPPRLVRDRLRRHG